MYNPIQFDSSLIDQKKLKALNLFWIGFIIYTLGFTFLVTTLANYILCEAVQTIGIVIFFIATIYIIQFKFENNYLKFIYILYVSWLFTVMLRGFVFDYDFLKEMLFDAWYGIFIYFVPLILLFPQTLVFYKKAFEIIVILSVFYVIFDVIFIKYLLNRDLTNTLSQGMMEWFTRDLSLSCGFLLLTYTYHSPKRKLFIWIITVISIFFAIIRARRGMLSILISPLILGYIIYLVAGKIKMSTIILPILLACLVMGYGVKVFNESSLFNSVRSRGLENTRSNVEDRFYSDMKTRDWIIGKGVNGQYYCPGIDLDDKTGYRNVIETDYLNIILKGGIISLGLLLLIAIPAVIKGFFYSKNTLSKAASVWILLWIISLYPATGVTFTLNYLLVWMSIGICYNKRIRNMPENVMKLFFSDAYPILKEV